MLALTARLRYHDLPYVRGLAGGSLGLLFRHASSANLRAGVRTLAAEAAARPASRTQPAGELLAAAVKGVDQGLHSKAGDVWRLLLRSDLLRMKDFNKEKVSCQQLVQSSASDFCINFPKWSSGFKGMDQGLHSQGGNVRQLLLQPNLLRLKDCKSVRASCQQQSSRPRTRWRRIQPSHARCRCRADTAAVRDRQSIRHPDAANGVCLQARARLGPEALRAQSAALAAAFVGSALRHAKRAACGALWTEVLAETGQRLQQYEAAEAAGDASDSSSNAELETRQPLVCVVGRQQAAPAARGRVWRATAASQGQSARIHFSTSLRTAAYLALVAIKMELANSLTRLPAGVAEARANVGRAAGLVASMGAFHHGSRVGDWGPLSDLTGRLLAAALPAKPAADVSEAAAAKGGAGGALPAAMGAGAAGGGEPMEAAAAAPAGGGEASSAAAQAADLTAQALRMLQAVLIGHYQVSGMSAVLRCSRDLVEAERENASLPWNQAVDVALAPTRTGGTFVVMRNAARFARRSTVVHGANSSLICRRPSAPATGWRRCGRTCRRGATRSGGCQQLAPPPLPRRCCGHRRAACSRRRVADK